MRTRWDPSLQWDLLWHGGPISQAFVLLTLFAGAVLVLALARSVARAINTDVFLDVVRKLVRAGNPQRALRLAHAAHRPVLLLTRAGLYAALDALQRQDVAAPAPEGGYRRAALQGISPGEAARRAMTDALDAAMAEAVRGCFFARVVGALACVLGVVVTYTLASGSRPLTAVMSAGIALLAVATWRVERRHARDLARTLAVVAALCDEPSFGA